MDDSHVTKFLFFKEKVFSLSIIHLKNKNIFFILNGLSFGFDSFHWQNNSNLLRLQYFWRPISSGEFGTEFILGAER